MSKREWIYALSVWVVIVLALFLLHKPAAAHDQQRPDLNNWFMGLKSTIGHAPCCSGGDAEVLKDVDWESKDGHYRVRIDVDNGWTFLTDLLLWMNLILDGQTLVWPIRGYYMGNRNTLLSPWQYGLIL